MNKKNSETNSEESNEGNSQILKKEIGIRELDALYYDVFDNLDDSEREAD